MTVLSVKCWHIYGSPSDNFVSAHICGLWNVTVFPYETMTVLSGKEQNNCTVILWFYLKVNVNANV